MTALQEQAMQMIRSLPDSEVSFFLDVLHRLSSRREGSYTVEILSYHRDKERRLEAHVLIKAFRRKMNTYRLGEPVCSHAQHSDEQKQRIHP